MEVLLPEKDRRGAVRRNTQGQQQNREQTPHRHTYIYIYIYIYRTAGKMGGERESARKKRKVCTGKCNCEGKPRASTHYRVSTAEQKNDNHKQSRNKRKDRWGEEKENQDEKVKREQRVLFRAQSLQFLLTSSVSRVFLWWPRCMRVPCRATGDVVVVLVFSSLQQALSNFLWR